MFRLLLRIGILAVMILALAIPKVDARAAPANAAALASQRRALLSARPPRNERRSLIEVATQGLFDLFGFEVGGRCRRAARPRGGYGRGEAGERHVDGAREHTSAAGERL